MSDAAYQSAKRKLAENRASGPDARKHNLTQAEIDAIMAENERRAKGGKLAKDKRGYFGKYRNQQATDAMNET